LVSTIVTNSLLQITINDLPVGRSVTEALRLIDAFKFTDEYGEVCPANWNPGEDTIRTTTEGKKSYLEKMHGENGVTNGTETSKKRKLETEV
jgi:peroxiredoxin (alkyl hydroperoxide reductase subunit C)